MLFLVKKGQAAMEFLMTYGWALLIVLVAIGALAYLGVLNPTRFTPDQCTVSPGFTCLNYKGDASGNGRDGGVVTNQDVIFSLQNGLGQSLSGPGGGVVPIGITLTPATTGGAATTCALSSTSPTSWADGATVDFDFSCIPPDASPAQGDKFKGTITLTYRTGGLDHSKEGQIVVSIEA